MIEITRMYHDDDRPIHIEMTVRGVEHGRAHFADRLTLDDAVVLASELNEAIDTLRFLRGREPA